MEGKRGEEVRAKKECPDCGDSKLWKSKRTSCLEAYCLSCVVRSVHRALIQAFLKDLDRGGRGYWLTAGWERDGQA